MSFSSRSPFTDDVTPWQAVDLRGEDYPHRVADEDGNPASVERLRMGYRYAPRPEFNHPQSNPTNRVLADLRAFWLRHDTVKLNAHHAMIYLLVFDVRSVLSSDAERAHALVVLSRLGAGVDSPRSGAGEGRERYTGVRALFNGDLHMLAPTYTPREDWIVVDARTIEHVRPVGDR